MSGKVAAVDERLELILEDGRRLKIIGVDPPKPTPQNPDLDIEARDRLALWLTHQTILFRLVEKNVDRWDRIPAFVFAPEPAQENRPSRDWLSVTEALLDAGLARYDAGARPPPCRDIFLAAEARARKSELGLWADPYYAVIHAIDYSSLAEKAGTIVLAEGRVRNVTNRKPRIMLKFETGSNRDLSVVAYAGGKNFGAVYAALAGLSGRNVRVRGLLDTRFGPQIELLNPDDIEVMDQADARSASPSAVSGR